MSKLKKVNNKKGKHELDSNVFINISLGAKLEYLDLSFNNLKAFSYFPAESLIEYLDISNSNLFTLSPDSTGIEIKQFLNWT